MHVVDRIYIDGAFVEPHGEEQAPLFSPSTEERIGMVRLGDEVDASRAMSAAKSAFRSFSHSLKAERIDMLRTLHASVSARADDLADAMREEYGAPDYFIDFTSRRAGTAFLDMAETLRNYNFRQTIGRAEVEMRPAGVALAITPWNANYGFICSKLATAIAAGTTIVIKPSEMSAIQTQVITEALHHAGLPAGVFGIVNGYGHVVGAALTAHPDVAKISFTGSTSIGKTIMQTASESMKRVTLELGGKSSTVVLDDTDLSVAIPQILMTGFANSGQACIAGTRILVPKSRRQEVEKALVDGLSSFKVGGPVDSSALIAPMVSAKQWERVQSYIRLGVEEGATVIAGGEGRPDGLERGWFTKPTIFSDVRNNMRIAQEEIFGPVLAVIPYESDDDAIAIANDTPYGLHGYVFSSDVDRAKRVACQIEAGRVSVNAAPHEPLAPFGGFKQSGLGREFGAFGLESFLEPKAILV